MSIAEKLTTITENMQAVYEAGRNSVKLTIDFGTGFAGVSATSPLRFEHKLGMTPIFVAIYADNPQNIIDNGGSASYVIQTDRFKEFPRSYLYCANGTITGATTTEATRLITGWDETYIYINAAASSRIWPPSELSTFTMVCFA